MPVFKVRRMVDAWVTYVAEVSAVDAEDAAEVAREAEGDLAWEEEGPVEFDARQFVTLNSEGDEIDGTQRGDF
jgi:hypothetical protein